MKLFNKNRFMAKEKCLYAVLVQYTLLAKSYNHGYVILKKSCEEHGQIEKIHNRK